MHYDKKINRAEVWVAATKGWEDELPVLLEHSDQRCAVGHATRVLTVPAAAERLWGEGGKGA